jgi:hypothetical protein
MSKDLLYFSVGLGVGLATAVLATPHAGVTTRKLLRSRATDIRTTVADKVRRGRAYFGNRTPAGRQAWARSEQLAGEYAGDAASDDGMAEARA